MNANNLEDFFSQFGDSIIKKLKDKAYEKVEERIGHAFDQIVATLPEISGRDELSTIHYNTIRHEANDLLKSIVQDQDGRYEELVEQSPEVFEEDEHRYQKSATRTRDTSLVHTFAALRQALIELLVEQEVATQTKQLVSTVAATLNAKLGTEIPAQSEKNSDTAPGM
jgi:hypothetical protein